MSKLDCTKVAVHMGVKCMHKTYSHSIFNQRLFLSFFQFLFLSFILFRNHRNTQQRKEMCEVKRKKNLQILAFVTANKNFIFMRAQECE